MRRLSFAASYYPDIPQRWLSLRELPAYASRRSWPDRPDTAASLSNLTLLLAASASWTPLPLYDVPERSGSGWRSASSDPMVKGLTKVGCGDEDDRSWLMVLGITRTGADGWQMNGGGGGGTGGEMTARGRREGYRRKRPPRTQQFMKAAA